MTTDIELLRQQAEQAESLLGAKERYQAALIQEQKQAALTQAEKEATELGENLDSKIDDFKTDLALAATELTSILTRLHSLESKFNTLGRKADDIALIVESQAKAEIRAGYWSKVAREQGLTYADNSFVQGLVTDKLKRRFGLPNPLTYNYSNLVLSDLSRWLLVAPYWSQVKMQFIGPSLGYQIEQQPDQTREIKINGPAPVTSNLGNGQGKMLNFEELEKLFPALAGK